MTDRILNGRYRIVKKVGSGGMADVYEGLDTAHDNKTVAIKVLKSEYSNDPQYLRRLMREAKAMVSLHNDHVVALYDMGNDGDAHYLVLEYVKGRTLREYMDEKGRFEPREAVDIVCKVLDGLSHAHDSGLVHRDVKPHNIMMTERGGVKLADFGIAKIADSSTKTYQGGEAMGSVYYISPEQAKGEEVDAQTDIYSVGVMLYEMLNGAPPFSGENAVQVALKHINDEMPPIHDVNSRIPVALSDVIERATSKELDVRYSSADDMRKDLRRAMRSPHSRFARVKKNTGTFDESEPGETGFKPKAQLTHIAIICAVIGVIAVFVVMFVISMSTLNDRTIKVPSFIGYTVEDAESYAQNRGLEIEVKGTEPSVDFSSGEICSQEPDAMSKAYQGMTVYVTVSAGNQTRNVPDLYGMTVDEAKKALESAELELDPQIEYVVGIQPIGTVINQSVNPHETVMIGDEVRITVCGGASTETTQMPKLTGMNVNKAIEVLDEAGIENYYIVVDTLEGVEADYKDYDVISQNPAEGMEIIYDAISTQIYIYRHDRGIYKAEFSENVTLTGEKNNVMVTMVAPIGEVVLFQKEYPAGTFSIPFTGHFWEKGSYTCVIYVNGSIYTSFVRNFE